MATDQGKQFRFQLLIGELLVAWPEAIQADDLEDIESAFALVLRQITKQVNRRSQPVVAAAPAARPILEILSTGQRISLIGDLLKRAREHTATFKDVGCGLAYLTEAIATGGCYEVLDAADEREAEFIQLLRELYPGSEHRIWDFFKFPE